MVVAIKQKPKKTKQHHRRHGTHQKRSNHFTKTYWPYIPLLLIVAAGIFVNSIWMRPNGVLGYATSMTAGGLLVGTNEQRTDDGLSSLTLNSKLSQAAQAKAEDMAARNYWSHTTPDGKEPWYFINNTGYLYQAAGENLAYGFLTSSDAITGWMNSPGHRANILNGAYREVGFGIANSKDYQGNGEETIVVAMYANPISVAASSPSSEAESEPATEPAVPAQTESKGQPIAASKNSKSQNISVRAVVPGPTKVARVQLATSSGVAPWSVYAVSAIAVLLLLLFILRHSLAWHRVLVRGETFVLKHKFLDTLIVSAVMLGYLLTRTVGIIQ